MPREYHGLPPGQALRRMAEGYQVSAALRTMVVLDLADHLAAGPRTVVELARASGTHVPSLARLLRALVALDLCAYDDAGRVQLTPLGDTLRADTPESMQVYVRMSTSAWFPRALEELPHAIRTGEPTFPRVYGVGCWDDLAAHPGTNGNGAQGGYKHPFVTLLPAFLRALARGSRSPPGPPFV